MAQFEDLIASLEQRVGTLESLPTAKAELAVINANAQTLTLQQKADAAKAELAAATEALELAKQQAEEAQKAVQGGIKEPVSEPASAPFTPAPEPVSA